ncbi:MAG: hypothetical protein ABSA70_16965, partial [Terriglobia bacterium]
MARAAAPARRARRWIARLGGRLKVTHKLPYRVTYHDPYNPEAVNLSGEDTAMNGNGKNGAKIGVYVCDCGTNIVGKVDV